MQHLEIMVLPFGNHGDILGLLQIFELIGGWNLCMPERVMFIASAKVPAGKRFNFSWP